MPESFRDSKSATWRGNNIIGRSSPIYGYAGSESRDFSVDLDLVASMDYQDGGSPNDVKAACDWLMSFTYPDYSGGAAKPPHTAIFRAAGQVQQRVIVKSVTVAYKPPFDPATGLAYRAKITLSMAEVEDDPKSYDELRAASGEMRF
jgi:hypothetical protein